MSEDIKQAKLDKAVEARAIPPNEAHEWEFWKEAANGNDLFLNHGGLLLEIEWRPDGFGIYYLGN